MQDKMEEAEAKKEKITKISTLKRVEIRDSTALAKEKVLVVKDTIYDSFDTAVSAIDGVTSIVRAVPTFVNDISQLPATVKAKQRETEATIAQLQSSIKATKQQIEGGFFKVSTVRTHSQRFTPNPSLSSQTCSHGGLWMMPNSTSIILRKALREMSRLLKIQLIQSPLLPRAPWISSVL